MRVDSGLKFVSFAPTLLNYYLSLRYSLIITASLELRIGPDITFSIVQEYISTCTLYVRVGIHISSDRPVVVNQEASIIGTHVFSCRRLPEHLATCRL
jgi:hypothetical protein